MAADPAPLPPWMLMEDVQHQALQPYSLSQVLGYMGDPSKVTVTHPALVTCSPSAVTTHLAPYRASPPLQP